MLAEAVMRLCRRQVQVLWYEALYVPGLVCVRR